MGYLEGFGVTIKKWFGVNTDSGRRVTAQYPEQTRPKPERFHGRHVLNRYDDGMEKCIGCELCAGVCPAKCIYVRGQDNDPEDPTSPGERFGFVYEINYLRCIHCDLCVEACPTEAITETKMFEFAFTNRSDAIYTKSELLVGDDGRPQQLPWENWDGGFDAAAQSSGWMRATAPSGDADFVGIVAWAGELGYGVRPPESVGGGEPSTDDHGHDDHGHDDHGHDDHGHDDHGHDDHGQVHDEQVDGGAPEIQAPEIQAHDDQARDDQPDADQADADRRPEPPVATPATFGAPDAAPVEESDEVQLPESLTRTEATPLLIDAVETDEGTPAPGSTDSTPTETAPTDEDASNEPPPEAEKPTAGFFDAPEEPADEAKARRRFGRRKGDRP